jgi:DNA adenine methylase
MVAARVKAPFPYFGGKQAMMRHILPLLPHHEVYVEIFGGAGSLLFAKAPAALEVYNDIDSALVNFFTVLRNDAQELIRRLELTPYARTEHRYCRKEMDNTDDPIERARRFYTATAQNFGGDKNSGGWKHSLSTKHIAAHSWVNNIDRLMECARRLRGVQVECDTFDRIIHAYDAPDVLFYADPPYVPATRRSGGYRHEMTIDDHTRLLEQLTTCAGMVILSGYNCPPYQEYLADWRRIDVAMFAQTNEKGAGGRQNQTRIESLWVKPNTLLPEQIALF